MVEFTLHTPSFVMGAGTVIAILALMFVGFMLGDG